MKPVGVLRISYVNANQGGDFLNFLLTKVVIDLWFSFYFYI